MRFVAIMSRMQQDVLALHRVRGLLIRERTALMNQIRGLLAECGIVAPQGAVRQRRALAEILGDRDAAVGAIWREASVEMSERLRSSNSGWNTTNGRSANSLQVTAAPAG